MINNALITITKACCFNCNSKEDIHPRYHNYCAKKVEEPCCVPFGNKWEKIVKYDGHYMPQEKAKKMWRAEVRKWQNMLEDNEEDKKNGKNESSLSPSTLLQDSLELSIEEEKNIYNKYQVEYRAEERRYQKLNQELQKVEEEIQKNLTLREVHPQLVGGAFTPDTSRIYRSDLEKILGLKPDGELVIYLGQKMTRESASSRWFEERNLLNSLIYKCNPKTVDKIGLIHFGVNCNTVKLEAIRELEGKKY